MEIMYKNLRFIYTFFLLAISFLSLAQTWKQVKSFKNVSKYSNSRMAIDSNGYIYLAGEFDSDSLILDSLKLFGSGSYNIYLAKLDSNFNLLWARSISNYSDEYLSAISIDRKGNLLLCGYFSNTLKVDNLTINSYGGNDFFIAKFNSQGQILWLKNAGSEKDEFSSYSGMNGGIVFDDLNNIYFNGVFAEVADRDTNATMRFDSITLRSYGGGDIFYAKMDEDGRIRWLKKCGSHSDDISNIALQGQFIYLVGGVKGKFNIDSQSVINPYFTSTGFIAKIDLQGNLVWLNTCFITDIGILNIRDVAIDLNGNMYITGLLHCDKGSLKFNNLSLTSSKGFEIFIAKLNSKGNLIWLNLLGGIGNDIAMDIICYNNNKIFLTGSINGPCVYQNRSILKSNFDNTFILEIDSIGFPILFESVGETGDNMGSQISLSKKGQLVILGDNRIGKLKFGNLILSNLESPAEVFIARTDLKAINTNTSKFNDDQFLKVYPIPSDGRFIVKSSVNLLDYKIEIYDLYGHQFLNNIKLEDSKLDLSILPSGIYYLKMINNNYSMVVKRVIIEN